MASIYEDLQTIGYIAASIRLSIGKHKYSLCYGCGKVAKCMRCGRCKITPYCSKECQRKNYEKHREMCFKFVDNHKTLEMFESEIQDSRVIGCIAGLLVKCIRNSPLPYPVSIVLAPTNYTFSAPIPASDSCSSSDGNFYLYLVRSFPEIIEPKIKNSKMLIIEKIFKDDLYDFTISLAYDISELNGLIPASDYIRSFNFTTPRIYEPIKITRQIRYDYCQRCYTFDCKEHPQFILSLSEKDKEMLAKMYNLPACFRTDDKIPVLVVKKDRVSTQSIADRIFYVEELEDGSFIEYLFDVRNKDYFIGSNWQQLVKNKKLACIAMQTGSELITTFVCNE